MSTYQGRRAPNVSQYLAELNTIPTAQEIAAQDHNAGIELDNDLALFTNAEFFDFDVGNMASDFDGQAAQNAPAKSDDYVNGDFNFQTYPYANIMRGSSTNPIATSPTASFQLPNSSAASSPVSPKTGVVAGEKRKLDSISGPVDGQPMEEGVRVAADEDKRRRNTAASARFRVKKKQREQALERTAKDMTDKVTLLESRVVQLETENKWLKNLLTEKHEKPAADTAAAYRKQPQGKAEARSTGDHTTGVGTTHV